MFYVQKYKLMKRMFKPGTDFKATGSNVHLAVPPLLLRVPAVPDHGQSRGGGGIVICCHPPVMWGLFRFTGSFLGLCVDFAGKSEVIWRRTQTHTNMQNVYF